MFSDWGDFDRFHCLTKENEKGLGAPVHRCVPWEETRRYTHKKELQARRIVTQCLLN
jgi:hypothetical protein